MRRKKTKAIEHMLKTHYRSTRTCSDPHDRARFAKTLVSMTGTMSALADDLTLAGFVVSQVRFIRRYVWVLNVALVAAMVVLCLFEKRDGPLLLAASILGAASVLIAIPSLLSSRGSQMVELECACRFDSGSVALARLIVFGCSDVLVATAMAIAVPIFSETDGFAILLHVCAPYFLACAGCLWMSRRISMPGTLMLSAGWVGSVMALAMAAYLIFPAMYLSASTGIWTLIVIAGGIWTARELCVWLRNASAGLDHAVFLARH